MNVNWRVKRILSFVKTTQCLVKQEAQAELFERLKSNATMCDEMLHSNDNEGSSQGFDNAFMRLISETEELARQFNEMTSLESEKASLRLYRPKLNTLTNRGRDCVKYVPFENILESDEDIIRKLTRSNTQITPPSYTFPKQEIGLEYGVVVGKLKFYERDQKIDCRGCGSRGKPIPRVMHEVTNITSEALFILVIENAFAFLSLVEEEFYDRFPCIIITSRGNPGVASGLFVRKLKMELNIPVFAIVDNDIKGIKMMLMYRFGSGTQYLDVQWLGFRPSDMNMLNIPEHLRIAMSESDIEVAKELLPDALSSNDQDLAHELKLMLDIKKKTEMEVMCIYGCDYLTQVYLPLKLQQIDA